MPDFARVKSWKSCEVNHLIFVWYHAEQEEPTWQPTDVPEIKSKKWCYRGRNEFIINSHIQVSAAATLCRTYPNKCLFYKHRKHIRLPHKDVCIHKKNYISVSMFK